MSIINIKGFYPTSNKINKILLDGIDFYSSGIDNILESSAGTGNIAEYISSQQYNNKKDNIDCIEINPELQSILKGKNYRVIHDDFLTFQTSKRYDLIAMNPPFESGDKHLLHALDLCKHGGMIRCILNAETITNLYTKTREELYNKLIELNASIEFIENAFTDAERKTNVTIAIIKVDIPESENDSLVLNNLKKEESYYFKKDIKEDKDLTFKDFIKDIVARYNFEIKIGIDILKEFFSSYDKIKGSFDKEHQRNIFNLTICDEKVNNLNDAVNNFIKVIRGKYWDSLFKSEKFTNLMTSKIMDKFLSKIDSLIQYDFSEFNIQSVQDELKESYSESVEKTILDLFDQLSRQHYWDKDSKNIHYYNGWKTNKAWKINKKVIIPMSDVWNTWGRGEFDPFRYGVLQKLTDIEKTFNYLSGKQNNHEKMIENLTNAKNQGIVSKIECEYFTLSFFRKGTMHINFTDEKLLEKLNIFGGQRKNFLPTRFGKDSYEEMDKEEQEVIDNFCTKDEYNEIYTKQDYYLVNKIELLT